MRVRAVLPTLAVVGGSTAVVLLVATVVVGVPWAHDREWAISMYWALAWIGLPTVGAVIAAKRPQTRIGWLLVAGGLAIGTGQFAGMWGVRAVHAVPGSLPWGELALILSHFELIGALLVALALLHFPSDRLLSRGWRVVAGVVVAAMPLFIVGGFLSPELPGMGQFEPVANPYMSVMVGAEVFRLAQVAELGAVVFVVAVLVNLVWRAVRSRGVERQQMKWIGLAAGLFVGCVAVAVALEAVETLGARLPDDGLVVFAVIAFIVSFNGMAVAIGFSVLRYRLYDIDRVASRTATYAALTVVLALVYAAGVVGIGAVLRPFTGAQGGDLVVAASTLTVAALFTPLRRRVQAVMDRRFNRAQVDAARIVESFAQRLRDELDRDAVTEQLREAATLAVEPARVHVWLR